MLNKFIRKHRLVVIALLMALPRNAEADPPAIRAMTQTEAGGRGFAAWRLACGAGRQDCAIGTEIRAADGSPVLRLQRPATGSHLRIVTTLPLFLPDGVSLAIGEAAPWAVAWRTCRGDTCTADLDLTPELQAALRRERTATVALTLEEGLALRFPVSLLGYTAAERALTASGLTAPGSGARKAPAGG